MNLREQTYILPKGTAFIFCNLLGFSDTKQNQEKAPDLKNIQTDHNGTSVQIDPLR